MITDSILPAVIRTGVPYLVGLVVSLGVLVGAEVPAEFTEALTGLLTFIIGTIYYVAAMWLQRRYPTNAVIKFLLGSPKQPLYPAKGE